MDKEKVIHIHNGILLSHKKKFFHFATVWMNLEGIILSEISQRQIPYDFIYIWYQKNEQTKQK